MANKQAGPGTDSLTPSSFGKAGLTPSWGGTWAPSPSPAPPPPRDGVEGTRPACTCETVPTTRVGTPRLRVPLGSHLSTPPCPHCQPASRLCLCLHPGLHLSGARHRLGTVTSTERQSLSGVDPGLHQHRGCALLPGLPFLGGLDHGTCWGVTSWSGCVRGSLCSGAPVCPGLVPG